MKPTRTIMLGFIIFALIVFNTACKHEVDPSDIPDPTPGDTIPSQVKCDPDTIYFLNEIKPLLNSGCAVSGCHDEATAAEGIVLTDYNKIMITGKVKPGNADDTKIVEVLTETGEDRMPPAPRAAFTAEQIQKIKTWINQGAQNNSCTELDCDSTNVSFASKVWPIIESSCLGCHSGATPSGGIRLAGYSDVATIAATGQLLGVITAGSGYSQMPPAGKLSDCQIGQIRNWIKNGTPNN